MVWKAGVLLLAGLFIYAPVFSGGWLLDDDYELTDNAAVQNPAGLLQIWRGRVGADYLPLKTSVQWLLWRAFGGNPTAFHLTSIALHLLSGWLLWRLFERLGLRHAWLGGLIFVVHPIEVESVAWVSELKNTLSLALLLPAMLSWLRFDERRRGQDYAWALALFVAALLCKASIIMWPAVILLHAWWKRGEIRTGDVKVSLPFFAVAAVAGAATILLQTDRSIRGEVYPLAGPASHLALAGMDIAFYLWKTVLPVGLLPMYPRWRIDPPAAMEFLPVLFVAALLSWLWTRRRTVWGRAAGFGWGFFLLNLLPVLGFLKMSYMRISWVADHFVYVPSLGIIGLAAGGVGTLYDRLSQAQRSSLRIVGGLALACAVVASRLHAEVYSGMEAMCRYTIESNPDAWLAHQLYAASAQRRKDFDTALAQASEAVRLRPDVAETQNSLGLALDSKGRFQEAVVHLQEAVRLAPQVWAIRVNLAKALTQAGQYELALREYDKLLQQTPRDPALHSNAGACLYGLGNLDGSIDQFRQALLINPDLPGVRANLALVLKARDGARRAPPP